MKRNLLLALSLIFMLTACASAPTASPTLSPAPSTTPLPPPAPTPAIEVHMPWQTPDEGYSPIPAGEEPKYFYDKPLGAFVPSDDYGAVYPYMGAYHFGMWGPTYQYGLCTADGRIITAPVYSAPSILGFGDQQAYLLYTETEQAWNSDGWYETVATPGLLVALDGSWAEPFDNAMQFIVPTMVYSKTLNYPVLAVQRDGLWGGLAMDGSIAVPFEHKQYFRMYDAEPFYRNDYSERPEHNIIRYDRMLSYERDDYGNFHWEQAQLLNERLEPLATIQGSHYATANDFFLQMNMDVEMIYAYDYDGNLLGEWEYQEPENWEIGINVASDYVMIPSVDGLSLTFCNKYLQPLFTLDSDTLWSFWGFGTQKTIRTVCNVFHTTDPTTNLHRTYRPDGTLLTTCYFANE